MESAGLKDKIPPFNLDAETAAIGSLLLDNEAISTVLRYLRANDYYKTAHQKIFGAIITMFQRGERADLITLTEELRSEGNLESCGGASYISSLTSAVPTAANIEYYAKIVHGCSVRRELLRIAAEITATAYDESRDGRVIVEEAEQRIFEIADKQQTGSYKHVREIVGSTITAIERLYHMKDNYTGIPSGFSELDDMTYGFQKSELIILGARPSVGKTALALTMAANMSIQHNTPVGFFTLEMSDMALVQRLVSSEARINTKTIRSGMLSPANFNDLTEAAGRIYEAPLYLDDTPSIKLLDLRAQARRMKSQHKIEILFIDYLTLIRSEQHDIPRHEQIAEISRSLKALARELDIPVIALSQVRRESEGRAPNLADLRESGSLEQDADVVMLLHRKEKDNPGEREREEVIPIELILAKQRNGPVGTLEIAFIPKYTKFESLAREAH
jgi:replicative DNA helicase